jgi:hypothetical protein
MESHTSPREGWARVPGLDSTFPPTRPAFLPTHDEHDALALHELVAARVAFHQRYAQTRQFALELMPMDVLAPREGVTKAVESLIAWASRMGSALRIKLCKADGGTGELRLRIDGLHGKALEPAYLDAPDWQVLERLARLKVVRLRRRIEPGRVRVAVRFSRVMERHQGIVVLEETPGIDKPSPGFDPARSLVWCVVPRGTLGATVLATLQPQVRNLRLLAALPELPAEPRIPDCIVSVPEVIQTEAFRAWRRRAQQQRGRDLAVIEITSLPFVFDTGRAGNPVARVGMDALASRLLAGIVFEMSRLAPAAVTASLR